MKQTILIIEDEEILLEVLQRKLEKEGFSVLIARDGEEGIRLIKEKMPNLVLLDIIMPRVDGYGVLEYMQKDSSLSKIPVIIISNSGQPVEIDRALSLGARDYLIKAQFSPLEVITKVREIFSQNDSNQKMPESQVPANKTTSKNDVSPKKQNGKSVAIIEDDQFLLELINRKLVHEGYDVLTAMDGEEGLKLIYSQKPDLVLLDIVMPLKDGFEVLSAVRGNADPKISRIPVIMLSNLGQESDIKKGKDLKATDYLIKASLTTDQIVKKIKDYL